MTAVPVSSLLDYYFPPVPFPAALLKSLLCFTKDVLGAPKNPGDASFVSWTVMLACTQSK